MYHLLETADIFLTSLRSGALKRLGLDYETLHDSSLVWFGLRTVAMASTAP